MWAVGDSPIVWRGGQPLTRDQLLCDVAAVLPQLLDRQFVINRCVDRYAFLVGFLATLIKGQISILPSNQLHQPLSSLANINTNQVYCLHTDNDGLQKTDSIPSHQLDLNVSSTESAVINFDTRQIAAQVYTSGSTGQPVAHIKRWQQLLAGTQALVQGLAQRLPVGANIVSTVPQQHMFGLETTVMLPLIQEVAVSTGRPFFPTDIHSALAAIPKPRLLISTPVHLRTCVEAGIKWPLMTGVYSSTGPLSQQLAAQVQQQFNCPVTEIYGASETGALAIRNAVDDVAWQLLPGMQLQSQANGVTVYGPQLVQSVILADYVENLSEGRFKLIGRSQEVVKIAGKRVALGELNKRLNDIKGIIDGVFWVPDDKGGERLQRLSAIIVAEGLEDVDIRRQLAQYIDPVFIPRRIVRVSALPRSATGKLARSALQALL